MFCGAKSKYRRELNILPQTTNSLSSIGIEGAAQNLTTLRFRVNNDTHIHPTGTNMQRAYTFLDVRMHVRVFVCVCSSCSYITELSRQMLPPWFPSDSVLCVSSAAPRSTRTSGWRSSRGNIQRLLAGWVMMLGCKLVIKKIWFYFEKVWDKVLRLQISQSFAAPSNFSWSVYSCEHALAHRKTLPEWPSVPLAIFYFYGDQFLFFSSQNSHLPVE